MTYAMNKQPNLTTPIRIWRKKEAWIFYRKCATYQNIRQGIASETMNFQKSEFAGKWCWGASFLFIFYGEGEGEQIKIAT